MKDEALQAGDVIILLGFGDGGYARQLLHDLTPTQSLIIVDPFQVPPEDIYPLLSRRIQWCFGADQVVLHAWLYDHAAEFVTGRAVLKENAPAMAPHVELYTHIKQAIQDTIRLAETNAYTLLAHGETMLSNILDNMPRLLTSIGVERLKGIGSGLPVVVIGGGPSLLTAFPALYQLQGQAILIATDTALYELRKRTITPDFICTLDPQAENVLKFQHEGLTLQIPLVCAATATPAIVRAYQGRVLASSCHYPLYERLARDVPDKGTVIDACPSVVHMALNLALLLAPLSVLLVGCDFCLSPYARDVWEDTVAPNLPDDAIVWEENVQGRQVKTIELFRVFRNLLGHICQRTAIPCINTSPLGLKIPGTTTSTLDAWGTRLSNDKGLHDRYRWRTFELADLYDQGVAPGYWWSLESAVQAGRLLLSQLVLVREQVAQIQEALATGQEEEVDRLIPRFAETFYAEGGVYEVLAPHAAGLSAFMESPESRAIDALPKGAEKIRQETRRAQHFYQGLGAVCATFHAHVVRCVNALILEEEKRHE